MKTLGTITGRNESQLEVHGDANLQGEGVPESTNTVISSTSDVEYTKKLLSDLNNFGNFVDNIRPTMRKIVHSEKLSKDDLRTILSFYQEASYLTGRM